MRLTNLNKLISTIFFTVIFSSLSSMAMAAELKIKVKNINILEGHLMLALYDSKESYDSGKAKRSSRVKVNKSEHTITIKDIAAGDYAIKLFHDENDNNKLDSNMVGIPKEGYGFSNNGGRFGQPDYKDAKFSITNKKGIEITLL